MRIAACIPAYGDMRKQFVWSLLALQKRVLKAGMDFGTSIVPQTLIDEAREELAKFALGERADYLLWLDTDMVFPANALERLLAHNLPVVGANYRTRREAVTESSASIREGGKPRRMDPKTEGLEEADSMGLGLCLMKAEVFAGLPQPWFAMVQRGEDAFFFRRLFEQKGIRPVVDHALSMEVGHVAETVLRFP